MTTDQLERKLYIVRKRAEVEVAASEMPDGSMFSMPSLSARTIVYKGLLLAPQIAKFYSELSDPDVTSALCLVHQRFSTNTFPTWQLAHPFHYVAHNGEINTVQGQRELDASRGSRCLRVGSVRRGSAESLPHHPAERQRFRGLRQRAGTAGAGRPLAAACRGHADPGSVGRQSAHGRGARRRSTNITAR